MCKNININVESIYIVVKMVVMFPKSIPLTRERKQYVASAQWFCHLPPRSYQLPPEHTSRLLSPLYIYNFSMAPPLEFGNPLKIDFSDYLEQKRKWG